MMGLLRMDPFLLDKMWIYINYWSLFHKIKKIIRKDKKKYSRYTCEIVLQSLT